MGHYVIALRFESDVVLGLVLPDGLDSVFQLDFNSPSDAFLDEVHPHQIAFRRDRQRGRHH